MIWAMLLIFLDVQWRKRIKRLRGLEKNLERCPEFYLDVWQYRYCPAYLFLKSRTSPQTGLFSEQGNKSPGNNQQSAGYTLWRDKGKSWQPLLQHLPVTSQECIVCRHHCWPHPPKVGHSCPLLLIAATSGKETGAVPGDTTLALCKWSRCWQLDNAHPLPESPL